MKTKFFYLIFIYTVLSYSCRNKPENMPGVNVSETFELKRIRMEPGYEMLSEFDTATGIAGAIRDGKWGYIDSTGKIILPFTNYSVSQFSDGLGLVESEQNQFRFVNRNGKTELDLVQYKNVFPFVNGYATVLKQDKYGLIDKNGKETIPCISDEGIFELTGNQYIIKRDGIKSVVDAGGKQVFPITGFTDIFYDNTLKNYILSVNGEWMVAEQNGKIIKKINDAITDYREGLYFLSGENGMKSAILNQKGDTIVPYGKYNKINPISDGLICVGRKTGEKYDSTAGFSYVSQDIGYIDATGKEVIPLKFKDVVGDFHEGLAFAGINGKYGFINKKGELAFSRLFEKAENFKNGFARITENGEYFYIDKNGKTIR